MAQLITVRLNKADQQPLGFRLQGGKDFGTPLVVQKVNGGSAAERAGLQAGDALIRVNATDVYTLRHQEAQDAIRAAGVNLELTVQRGGGTWRPAVTPTGSLPRPGSRALGGSPALVTSTSLKATPQPSRAFGSGHNNVAKPFGYMNGNDSVKSIVNKQYNTPVNMYSDKTIAETLSAQTEVLAGGVLGVNFKKNEKTYDAEKSAVFKVLQEEQNDPEPEVAHPVHQPHQGGTPAPTTPVSGLRHVQAPVTRPDAPVNNTGGLPPGQNICEECERLITGVFVRIKDKNLHVECFKCSTCGSSLKNQGYYNLNGKLYCDIHAKLVARQNPPASNLEPVTVPPGGRIPTNTYSTPLPPLATNNYTNGSSSLFSPSSNLSGPKPFGSSIGSAYSPSLSPRSAPLSPARPVTAPAPQAPQAPAPAPLPAHQPAAPFAPTNEPLATSSPHPHKTEFKSPAEERLIRKMAKMALNGYEIGIQRKIKPADHIQSMADKIQDTVVTKHPLNSDSTTPGENTTTKTLDRGYKTHDNIQSMGDKIKDTLKNNHTINESLSKSYVNNTNVLIPPPLPTTPIPTFNAHNSAIGLTLNNNGEKKKLDTAPKSVNTNIMHDERVINSVERSHNGSGYSSSEDSCKDKIENIYTGTLKKTGLDKSSFLNSMNGLNGSNGSHDAKTELKFDGSYSNTLNKKKMFERSDAISNSTVNNGYKPSEKANPPDTNTWNKTSTLDQTVKSENVKNTSSQDEELIKNKDMPQNLYNNSLYTYKQGSTNKDKKLNGIEENKNTMDFTSSIHADETKTISDNDDKKNVDEEVVVRRRQKKNSRDDDGRRDSHIIARPLSTIQCADVADGLYPVCHKCDKAITRGPFITALGRIWCPEHFICVNATCRRPLQDIGFVEENGQLYCEFCFEQYIAPACDKCHAKIKGDCLNAIGKHYHPECFNCVYCGKLFGNNPFFLEDGLPYCETGMTCLRQNVSPAVFRWKPATGGSRRSTITTTVSASTARCAKRTSKDRASSQKEDDLSVRHTPARSPQHIMYNSDTVYTTTTFRPVSPSPITPPLNTPSPQRTRKLETPLHFDGGLFSDIRSTEGKLLSKVTVDRVQRSTRHDITDSPSVNFEIGSKEANYVDDIVKTETITNEDVITVKFTPVLQELDSPRLLTPSIYRMQQKSPTPAPVQYIKDNFEDLQSYKIVNSVCKEKLFETDNIISELSKEGSFLDILDVKEPVKRACSPLANLLISEQLTKIDSYLQESLEVCSGAKDRFTPTPANIASDVMMGNFTNEDTVSRKGETHAEKQINFTTVSLIANDEVHNGTLSEEKSHNHESVVEEKSSHRETLFEEKTNSSELAPSVPSCDKDTYRSTSILNSASSKRPGVLSSIYNMPIHYHATILCFLLIIYNLIYQYIKQNCNGNKK